MLHNCLLFSSPHCTAVRRVSQGLQSMTLGWWIFPEAHPNRNWASAVCIEVNSPTLPGADFMVILDTASRGYQLSYCIVLSLCVNCQAP